MVWIFGLRRATHYVIPSGRGMQTSVPCDSNRLWRSARAIYPLYKSLASEFVIEVQPCRELEEGTEVPTAEAMAETESWFETMDQRIQASHLRQFLQTSAQVRQAHLVDLLLHHLSKQQPTDHDRDKVDFLLVQFYSRLVSANASDSESCLAAVASALEPVLGNFEVREPEWLAPLNDILAGVESAPDLNSLFTSRVIERGRELKFAAGDRFFEPSVLAVFTRFGFLVRRRFFRLMRADLNAVLDGLFELQSRGMTTLDCSGAQFSAQEPISRLQMICQSWKTMFQAEYSAGQPLAILVDLRKTIEAALIQIKGVACVAKAAAAGTENGIN